MLADAAIPAASKFSALMAGEDRATDYLDAITSRAVEWRPHTQPCHGFGGAQLIAAVVDPATATTSEPREIHLVKGLLREEEIDRLRAQFDACGSDADVPTHARILVEDGRVISPELHALLSPALETRILPYVRARMGDQRVVVADALIRAYRDEDRRQALAPHFDVTSFATVIIPLNAGVGEYEGAHLHLLEACPARLELLSHPVVTHPITPFHIQGHTYTQSSRLVSNY